jgi:hypothetical protein
MRSNSYVPQILEDSFTEVFVGLNSNENSIISISVYYEGAGVGGWVRVNVRMRLKKEVLPSNTHSSKLNLIIVFKI